MASTGLAVITNLSSASASIVTIAAGTVVHTVAVGTFPNAVAITPSGTYAVMATVTGSVSIITIAAGTVVHTVAVGSAPRAVAITPSGTYAVVANFSSASVSIITIAAGTVVHTVTVGSVPRAVAITPSGTYAVVTNLTSNFCSIVTIANGTARSVTVTAGQFTAAVSHTGAYGLLALYTSTTLAIITIAAGTVAHTVTVGTFPYAIATVPVSSVSGTLAASATLSGAATSDELLASGTLAASAVLSGAETLTVATSGTLAASATLSGVATSTELPASGTLASTVSFIGSAKSVESTTSPPVIGAGFGAPFGRSLIAHARNATTVGYAFLARSRGALAVPTIRPPLAPPPHGRPPSPTPTTSETPPPPFLPSTSLVSIPRVSETYPQPVLSAGVPYATAEKKPWLPSSITRGVWAKQLQIVIGGQDVTFFRGVPNIVKKWSSQEPFGDASATILLSAVTSFDAIRQPVPFASGAYVGIASTFTNEGYWACAATGEVTPFGDASFFGDALALLNAPASGIASHPTKYGYAVCAQDGGVFAFGAVPFEGSIPGRPTITLNAPIVGIALTATGNGYWLVSATGDVYSFGDATYHGNAAVGSSTAVGIARSEGGNGYVICAANGGVFALGDAAYRGNGLPYYIAPYVGIATTPGVTGYLLVNNAGYSYAFGTVHYHGGRNGQVLASPIIGVALAGNTGYWQMGADGGLFTYGTAGFYGSIPGGGMPSGGSLSWLYQGATVTINAIASTGAVTNVFEGQIGDWEDTYQQGSVGLVLQVTGCLFALDWLIAKPITNAPFVGYSPYTGQPVFGWDLGHAIAQGINASLVNPSIGTALGSQSLPVPPGGAVTSVNGRVNFCTPVSTGIITVQMPQWGKLMSTYVQQILAQGAVQGGQQWTVHLQRPRTPIVTQKNLADVTWTVSTGGRGVQLSLSQTITSATSAIYGQGSSPPVISVLGTVPGELPSYRGVVSEWANLQYPRTWVGAVPAWPLGANTFFAPGDGRAGLQPLTTWLRQCGWPMASQNTYINTQPNVNIVDAVMVQRLQCQFGQQQTGYITQAFWDAAFTNGVNSETLSNVWYAPLWETARVEPYTYSPSGAIVGYGPFFTKNAVRVERYEKMGQMVGKSQGLLSAYLEGDRMNAPPWVGSITLTSDPEEGSRFEIVAGQNILLRYFHGRSQLMHISAVTVTVTKMSVKLTVASIATDLMTLAAIYARDQQALGVSRQARPNLNNLNISSSTVTFDSESGAGVIPATRLSAGEWVVIRVPATESGQIAEITLTCVTPDTGTPGQWSMGVFAGPVTPSQLAGLFGVLGPLQPAQITVGGLIIVGANPWSGYALQGNNNGPGLNALGLLYAAGGPGSGSACGFFPSTPSGQAILTGRYLDASSWTYNSAPGYAPWLWVAFYLTILTYAGYMQPYGVGPVIFGTPATTAVISGHLLAAPHGTK